MNISIVDKRGALLSVENRTLRVDDQKIPLRLVDTLIVASSHTVDTKELIKIANEDISIIFLSHFGDKCALMTSTKSKNAQLKLEQYGAQKSALSIARYIITQKVASQAEHMQKYGCHFDVEHIYKSIKSVQDIQTLLGIEGSFSRRYFAEYFKLFPKDLHSGKRTKNPPLDPVNATMSFIYMLFYNLISIKLIAQGFEPTVGFLHKPFRSHNALSSDLMEFIRSDINEFVYHCFNEQRLQKSDFSKRGGVYLKYEGRKRLWGDLKQFMQSIDKKIDKEIAALKVMF